MLVCSVGLVVLAQGDLLPEQQLSRARVCATDLDFECAERLCEELEAQLDQLPSDLALEALVLGAEVSLSMERWSVAEERLLRVLLRDPRFAPKTGAWPPRWRQAWEAARARVPDQEGPAIAIGPIEGREGSDLVVRATVSDPSGVGRVSLFVLPSYQELVMTSTGGGSYFAVVPAAEVHPPSFSFWLEAFDLYQNGPSRAGSVQAPLEARVHPPGPGMQVTAASAASPPLTSRWWFWTGLGVAAAGVGAVVAWTAASRDDSGSVRASVAWPER